MRNIKAVISTTLDDKYVWFVPLVTHLLNKLDVGVILFVPRNGTEIENKKLQLGLNCLNYGYSGLNDVYYFDAPKHKEATYCQCLRNYAACLDMPEEAILFSSDIDMGLFKIPKYIDNGMFSVFGYDLVPQCQFPQCYVTAPAKAWREVFNLNGKTYQQAIDELLGEDECENYRGCRWSVDQEQSFLNISKVNHNLIARARPNTQWAANRVDRDDINWKAYVNEELVDAHLWRPGYADGNFENIMELLTMKYPDDNFDWLRTYNEQYKQLL